MFSKVALRLLTTLNKGEFVVPFLQRNMRCIQECKSWIHNTARSEFSSRDSVPVIPASYPKDEYEYIPDGYTSQELCNLLRSNNLSIADVVLLGFANW